MGTSNFSDEFKRDAVHQITGRSSPAFGCQRALSLQMGEANRRAGTKEAGRGLRSGEPATKA